MEFQFEPRAGYLLVVARGAFDAQACRAAFDEVARACTEHRLDRVLVDARAIAELIPIADRFDLANKAVQSRVPRIAVLVSEANALHSKTFENAASNRGTMALTTSKEAEAYAFLGIAPPGVG